MSDMMSMLGAIKNPDIYGAVQRGLQDAQTNQANTLKLQETRSGIADKDQLRALAPQIFAGDPNALAQSTAIDPESTAKVSAAAQQQNQLLYQGATAITTAYNDGTQAGKDKAGLIYHNLVPSFRFAHPGVQIPDVLDDSTAQQIAAIGAVAPIQTKGSYSAMQRGADGYLYVRGPDGQVHNTGVLAGKNYSFAQDGDNNLIWEDRNVGNAGIAPTGAQQPPPQGTVPPSLIPNPNAPPAGGQGGQLTPQPSPGAATPVSPAMAEQILSGVEKSQGSPFVPAVRQQMLADLVAGRGVQVSGDAPAYQDGAAAPPVAPPAAPPGGNAIATTAPVVGGPIKMAPKGGEQNAPAGYAWTDASHTKQMRIPGGPADTTSDSGIDQKEVDFYATQELAGDRSWRTGLRGKPGQAVLNSVLARVPGMAEDMGLSPQDVGTNKATNVALTKTLADRTKYSTALNQYGNQLTQQAALVESLLDKGLAGGQSPVLNRWIQAGRTAVEGDEDVTALNNAIVGLAREHSRYMTGPMSNAQLSVSAANTSDTLTNTAMNAGQIRASIKEMESEVKIGLNESDNAVEGIKAKLSGLGKAAGSTAAPSTDWIKARNSVPVGKSYKGPDGQMYVRKQ